MDPKKCALMERAGYTVLQAPGRPVNDLCWTYTRDSLATHCWTTQAKAWEQAEQAFDHDLDRARRLTAMVPKDETF